VVNAAAGVFVGAGYFFVSKQGQAAASAAWFVSMASILQLYVM
jgi:hypothetical protein